MRDRLGFDFDILVNIAMLGAKDELAKGNNDKYDLIDENAKEIRTKKPIKAIEKLIEIVENFYSNNHCSITSCYEKKNINKKGILVEIKIIIVNKKLIYA